jgi:hypothetical protein
MNRIILCSAVATILATSSFGAEIKSASFYSNGSPTLELGTSLREKDSKPSSQCVVGTKETVNLAQAFISSSAPQNWAAFGIEERLFGKHTNSSEFMRSELAKTPEGSFYTAVLNSENSFMEYTDEPASYLLYAEILKDGKPSAQYSNQESWQSNCGENYIIERRIGGDLFLHLQVDGENKQGQCFQALHDTKLSKNAYALFKLTESDAKQIATACKGNTLEIQVLQRGGNPEDLKTHFPSVIESENRAYGSIKCSIENIKPCGEAAKSFYDYAYKPDGFSKEIGSETPVGKRGGPIVIDYGQAPVYLDLFFPTKVLQDSALTTANAKSNCNSQ